MRANAKTFMYFAWYCFMLFGPDYFVEAATASLRGNSVQEQEVASVAPPTRRNLIIGGNAAKPGDYPYFAHFEGISCGGSLIAPDVVLTAGHVSFLVMRKNLVSTILFRTNQMFHRHRSANCYHRRNMDR
jgi:Trypsin